MIGISLAGNTGLLRRLNNGTRLLRVTRKRHRQRLDLIMRRVRRVKLAGQVVKLDLAVGGGECGVLLRWRHASNTTAD